MTTPSAVFLLIGSVLAGQAPQDAAVQERTTCGPRAVVVLARLMGVSLDYQKVRREIGLSDRGTSIAEVGRVLKAHGIDCTIRRLDPTQLLTCPTPLIVHHVPRFGTPDGHFLVLTEVGQEGLTAIDPMLGKAVRWKWSSFSDAWSGFAVIPVKRTRLAFGPLGGLLALAVHLTAFAALALSARRPSRAASPAGRPLRSALLLFASAPVLHLGHGGASRAGPVIRSHARDGLNAAALLAGLRGRAGATPGRPAAPGEEPRSFKDVQAWLVKEHSIRSSVYSLDYGGLAEAVERSGPVVVHLRHRDKTAGNFYVVLDMGPEYVTVVQTGLLVVNAVPIEDFRRRWTGHALVPVPDQGAALSPKVVLGVAIAVVISRAGYRLARRRTGRSAQRL